MWNLDKDPHLTSVFANVTVLDCAARPGVPAPQARPGRPGHPPAPPAGRARLRPSGPADVGGGPGLRPRLPPALDGPARAPATSGRCMELATRLHQQPFERGRPLWEFVVVEGLPDGRAAMVQKLHHTVTDGVGGLRLAERFLDLERSPVEPDTEVPVARPDQRAARARARRSGPGHRRPRHPPGGRHHQSTWPRGPTTALVHPDRGRGLALEAGETVRLGGPPGRRHQRGPLTALDRALPLAGAGRAPGPLRRREGRRPRSTA